MSSFTFECGDGNRIKVLRDGHIVGWFTSNYPAIFVSAPNVAFCQDAMNKMFRAFEEWKAD